MVDFAGWQMPVQYTSIVQEHLSVRNDCGLFDIGHMGRLWFTGADASRFLDHLLTNDVASLVPGQIRYSLVTNEQGGTLDDVLIYRLTDSFLLVVNASNRKKILDWIQSHLADFDVEFSDRTMSHFMLALQGPKAQQVLQPLTDAELALLQYYHCVESKCCGWPSLISRTGYTGEDGFEVIVSAEHALTVWTAVREQGRASRLVPCGLGCRDTLRLEAGMPLYGHELNETIDPYTAGLGFAVKLDGRDFPGHSRLVQRRVDPARKRRVGLILQGKRIAREGAEVWYNAQQVGTVTSGTFSPTLERSLAMAYVAAEMGTVNQGLEIDIRGQREPATVVPLPFYRRST